MNKLNRRRYLSTIRQYQNNRLEHFNLNDNGQLSSNQLIHYRRNNVRYRKNSSRSRSRNKTKFFHSKSSTDYRKKFILLALQFLALLHLCSLIYCHKKLPLFSIKYTIITYILFNFLTYSCVQYDTERVETGGGLLLGESPLLFLIWYGGIVGGGLALLMEKHKHLRSRAFTYRLRLIILFNASWLLIAYILYMCRKEYAFIEVSSDLLSFFEARLQS